MTKLILSIGQFVAFSLASLRIFCWPIYGIFVGQFEDFLLANLRIFSRGYFIQKKAAELLHFYALAKNIFPYRKKFVSLQSKISIVFCMMDSVNVSINLPRSDMRFMRQLGRRMGWNIKEIKTTDALFDPESGEYLNEETMQAIRDVEEGEGVMRCKSIDELLAVV